MSQTIVRQALRPAVPGGLFDAGFHDIISKSAEGAIGFGLAVIEGTDPETQCQLPQTSLANFLGVAARDNKEQQFVPTLGTNEYDDEDTVGIVQEGRVWVLIVETVTIASAVTAWFDLGIGVAGAPIGAFGDTDDAESALITAGARYFRGATFTAPQGDSGNIAVLSVGPRTLMAP